MLRFTPIIFAAAVAVMSSAKHKKILFNLVVLKRLYFILCILSKIEILVKHLFKYCFTEIKIATPKQTAQNKANKISKMPNVLELIKT